jgi:hypothetical protein
MMLVWVMFSTVFKRRVLRILPNPTCFWLLYKLHDSSAPHSLAALH